MKAVIAPDCHLNKSTYKGVMDKDNPMLPFRNVDFMKAFEYIVDKSIDELKPDLFVIPGDTFDNYHPSNDVRGFFSAQLQKLISNGIPVIILIGNHEICQKHHALKGIMKLKLPKIKVIEKHTVFTFKGHNLLIFPYSVEVEQKKLTIREDFENFVSMMDEKRNGDENAFDSSLPSIFFGHFGVNGGKLNQYFENDDYKQEILGDLITTSTTTEVKVKKDFINTNPEDISCDDLDRLGADYVILGDYHAFQTLPTKKCVALYPGSAEKSDLSELDQTKGFIVYDSENEERGDLGKCRFIEYPHCRPMLELKGNMKDIMERFAAVDYSKFQGAIVKIFFVGDKKELIDFSTSLDMLRKQIVDKIDPVHMFHEQKVKHLEQEEAASQLEQEILDKGHIEADDIKELVSEIIGDRHSEDKDEAKATIDLWETEIFGKLVVE